MNMVSDTTRERQRAAALARTPEQEARRLAAVRSPESRAKMRVPKPRTPEHQAKLIASLRANGTLHASQAFIDAGAIAREKCWQTNRGRKCTPEQIERIRAGTLAGKAGKPHPMQGKHHSPESLEKMRLAAAGKCGPASGGWRGGITPANLAARLTPDYKAWRQAVFERDSFTCQRCQERGGRLHANHIYAFADFPDKRLELSNGVTLCEKCHRYVSTNEGRAAEPQWYVKAKDLSYGSES